MQILYTGAANFNQPQLVGYLSLGGLISSSEVQNDELNAIFGSISEYGKHQRKPEYRVLAIYNDGAETLTNLKMWIDTLLSEESDVIDSPYSVLKIGYGLVTADDCGDLSVEKLPTPNSKPYTVTLIEAEGVDNAITLPDLESEMYLGIFLSRTILPAATEELTDEQYCDVSEGELSLATEDTFELNFSFDP